MVIDSYRHQGMRKRLVEELIKKGISDKLVLAAIESVPRHLFMDNAFLEYAYQDKAFPIDAGQTISQPYTVAYQSQLLSLEKGMKVLEVGTGSGYQTGVLYRMGAKVFSIERHRVLYSKAQKLMVDLDYNVKLYYGDGFKGVPSYAPYDRILVTCGAPEMPQGLLSQLAPNGIMVIPLGANNEQIMTIVLKKKNNSIEIVEMGKFKFVPMLTNKA
jgi:protein-L-isoaspartate(D-aspartate) O-methyltransferase